MVCRKLTSGLAVAFVLSLVASTSGREFYVASWNLENLFDTEDDPTVESDEDFTPDAPKKWTPERLEIKLGNQAKIIRMAAPSAMSSE